MKNKKRTKIYQLYLSLSKKYGSPEGFWKKWCQIEKTTKEKEEITLGAILTQRTNWKNVELALKNLKKAKALSVEKIFQIGKENINLLENLIRPSGFYKQKAKRLFQLCKFVIENHRSLEKFFDQDLKTCRGQLLQIPGIGPETADTILLYVGEFPIFVIDEYTRRFVKKYHLSRNFSYFRAMRGNKVLPKTGSYFERSEKQGSRQRRGSYDNLQQLFQKNLPKDIKIYQDFHAMIVLEGKGTGWDLALKFHPKLRGI